MENSHASPTANQPHHRYVEGDHGQTQDLIAHITSQNWMKNSALNLNTKIVAPLPFRVPQVSPELLLNHAENQTQKPKLCSGI